MLSGGSDQTTNILVYIPTPTHQSALQKKREKDRLKQQQQFTYTTHFSINFLFYFLLRLFISNLKFQFYHSTINLCTASMAAVTMTMQLFLKDNLTIWAIFFFCFCFWTAFPIKVEIYRQYIGPGCTRSALARELIWKGILIYRRYIGAGCTRSALARQLIF